MPVTIQPATLRYKNGDGQFQTADCIKGDIGDPSIIIDDTSGSGDTGKVWSADKVSSELDGKLDSTLKGAANGIAELDQTGKVPSSQLPSYVDDVLEYASLASFPQEGESGKIYVALDTNKTYRWGGSAYAEISESLALGETSTTAYRGDRGKVAYEHATDSGKIANAQVAGLYKIAVTAEGHIASVSAVTASDIIALGIIDDTAGDGDTNKVWSADKSADLMSAITPLTPSATASDVGKYLKAKTVSDGKVTEYEFGEGGTQITVDSALSDSSTNPVQNKVITGVVNKLSQPKLSRNIYNGEMWSVNGYFQDSGTFVSDNGYRTTDPVYLEAGNYMFNVRKASVGSSALKVFVVNSTGETVQSVVQGTDSGLMFNEETNIVTFTLANACYTRYNMASSRYASSFMIVKGSDASTYPTTYIPYVEGDLELKSTLGLTEQMVTEVEALKLKGKKLSVNGDSICYGEGYTGGYAKIIGDTYGMTVQNVAVSGGTITAETYSGSSARHWISRTITSMASDADFAIIEGGVNDAALTASISLGTLTNDFSSTLDDTTYIGALESTLKQLTTRFAGKKYGFIIVHKASTNFSNMGSDNSNWYWATRHALEKWGVPYLDLNVACPPFGLCSQQYSPELYALAQAYTKNGDGWHPNEDGYKKYYVPKIVSWMCSL